MKRSQDKGGLGSSNPHKEATTEKKENIVDDLHDEDEDDDLDTDFEEWKRVERERRKRAREDKRRSLEAQAKKNQKPVEEGTNEKSREKGKEKEKEGEGEEIDYRDEDHQSSAITNTARKDFCELDEEEGKKIVKLNIGGRKYVTTVKTLMGQGKEKNYFSALFGNKFAAPVTDAKGFLFIDRNGSLFEPILDYLRTGQWVCPSDLPEWVYLREARFYSVFPTPYTSLSDKCLNERLNKERDTSRKLKCQKYEKEFSEIKQYLLESFIPQVDEGKADVFSPIFFPSTKTIMERLQASGRGWRTTKKEIKQKFQSKNTTIVFNDSLYNAIRSASALLLWDLKTNHGLTVEIYYKNGIGLVLKEGGWEMVDWLPYETENGIRGFRFIWSQSKLS